MLTARPRLYLVDRPSDAPTKRQRLIMDMAQHLLAHDAFHNAEDATASLRSGGFRLFDVMAGLDDARQAAFQQIVDLVAEAMADG
jgi:hypothetical protein